jgi:peptidoglycan/xylan/chitin deacetylase (PgdA/CDA1 family)
MPVAWFFVVLLFVWFALPYILRKIQVTVLRRQCRNSRTIVLTYDDGPSALLTEKIVELLGANSVKATFFVLGHKLHAAGDVVDRLVRAGHEIGSHSYRHLNAWKCAPIAVYRDIEQGLATIKVFGACKLFRPPHGKSTMATMAQVTMSNCAHAWWTIDSSDTWTKPMSIDRVVDRIRREGGGVILMHDHERTDAHERDAFVLALTERILELARTERYRIVPMGELCSR